MNLFAKKITEIDLAFTKEYLKVDYEDEDLILTSLIEAAKSYVDTMLGFKVKVNWPYRDDIPDELTIACLMIIAHWFDNRQMQTSGTLGDEIAFAVSAIIDAHKDHFKEFDENVL